MVSPTKYTEAGERGRALPSRTEPPALTCRLSTSPGWPGALGPERSSLPARLPVLSSFTDTVGPGTPRPGRLQNTQIAFRRGQEAPVHPTEVPARACCPRAVTVTFPLLRSFLGVGGRALPILRSVLGPGAHSANTHLSTCKTPS